MNEDVAIRKTNITDKIDAEYKKKKALLKHESNIKHEAKIKSIKDAADKAEQDVAEQIILVITKDGKTFNFSASLFKYSRILAKLQKGSDDIYLDNRIPSKLFVLILEFLEGYNELKPYELNIFNTTFIQPSFDIHTDKCVLNNYTERLKKWYNDILELKLKDLIKMLGIAQYLEITPLIHVIAKVHALHIL